MQYSIHVRLSVIRFRATISHTLRHLATLCTVRKQRMFAVMSVIRRNKFTLPMRANHFQPIDLSAKRSMHIKCPFPFPAVSFGVSQFSHSHKQTHSTISIHMHTHNSHSSLNSHAPSSPVVVERGSGAGKARKAVAIHHSRARSSFLPHDYKNEIHFNN